MRQKFYLTTTLPYVNGEPHVGFALEIVEADAIARFRRLRGAEVIFNTGTDEHGRKIFEEAEGRNMTPQEYCDGMAEHFRGLKELLDLSWTNFIRTTDDRHILAAQEFWRRCDAHGDIYKKRYQVKYCVGCELEKTDSELEHGRCPIHPNREIELVDEENYFFRFSTYQEPLLALYRKHPGFVLPEKRQNEIRAFVERGLQDFSISRLRTKLPWGIPVPGDDTQVMYVWFDALVNYVSTLGWPETGDDCGGWWPGVQIAGKDNLRQQSAMWQAMLLSAGLKPSREILINGFINVDGQKMSKSLGNVISPKEMVGRFGVDGTRYLLLSLGTIGEDFDITWERLAEKYNADLANGLGNLVSRVLKLGESVAGHALASAEMPDEFVAAMEAYRISDALEHVWDLVRSANKRIEEEKPWELHKTDPEAFGQVMGGLLTDVAFIGTLLKPFLPGTSGKIEAMLQGGPREPLFPRL